MSRRFLLTALAFVTLFQTVTCQTAAELIGCSENSADSSVDCGSLGLSDVPNVFVSSTLILSLSNNLIPTIDLNDFQVLTALTTMDLSFNLITFIEEGALDWMANLLHLDLSHNDLTVLTSPILTELNNLLTVDLSHNNIDEISRGALLIPTLESLNLGFNQLEIVFTQMFFGLPNIKHISLEGNQLTLIDDLYFSRGEQLETINIANNSITTLPGQAFAMQTLLQTLDLRNNQIEFIALESFLALQSLEFLFMDGNPSSCTIDEDGVCENPPCDIECVCAQGLLSGPDGACTLTTPTTTVTTTATTTATTTISLGGPAEQQTLTTTTATTTTTTTTTTPVDDSQATTAEPDDRFGESESASAGKSKFKGKKKKGSKKDKKGKSHTAKKDKGKKNSKKGKMELGSLEVHSHGTVAAVVIPGCIVAVLVAVAVFRRAKVHHLHQAVRSDYEYIVPSVSGLDLDAPSTHKKQPWRLGGRVANMMKVKTQGVNSEPTERTSMLIDEDDE